MPEFSDGDFSYVFFFLDRTMGWETYTFRQHRVSPERTRIPMFAGLSDFNRVYVETSLLRA
jgi:hypothetical protein